MRRQFLREDLKTPLGDGVSQLLAPRKDFIPVFIKKLQSEQEKWVLVLVTSYFPVQPSFAAIKRSVSKVHILGRRKALSIIHGRASGL